MNTQRNISTISYNSLSFLSDKLKQLRDQHIISDYMFIYHYAEEDESKDHFHLWIRPNKRLDTMVLQDMFKEPDPVKLDKMLGCIDFRTSDPDEWIPYVLHDKRYLKYKRQSRKYSYIKDDMIVADPLNFEELYRHAFRSSVWNDRMTELELINDDSLSGYDLISSGLVDWKNSSAMLAYEKLADRHIYS